MKKTLLNMLMALVSVAVLTACGGSKSSDGTVATEPTGDQVFPTCTITQGVPLTDSQITVHVVCAGGNINIDEATVTVDNQVKSVDFTGSSIDDYIGFRNLQEDTVYTVVLNAIVDGQVFTDYVDIRTNDIPVVADTTPPVITVTGGTTSMTVGGVYTAPVVTASDDVDGDITSDIVIGGDVVNPNTVGTYVVTYEVTDSSGNSAATKTHTVVVSAVPVVISTPTITMADKTVNDEGGSSANPVGTPVVTGANGSAVYSLTTNPTGGFLTIDSSTGAMTWNGDTFGNGTTDFTITVKITNPDGGNDSDTFVLSVIDNG